jgi:hypothetical protein
MRGLSDSPETRFQSYVLGVMTFVAGSIIVPALKKSPPWIAQHLPTDMLTSGAIGALIAGLLVVGLYKSTAVVLAEAIKRIAVVRRWILGPYYFEGTWIGWYQKLNDPKRYIVETFEQDLTTIHIRGESYSDTGILVAQWHSVAVNMDIAGGRLVWLSEIAIQGQGTNTESVIALSLVRKSQSSAPTGLQGFAADLADGVRVGLYEEKWLGPRDDALKAAQKKF